MFKTFKVQLQTAIKKMEDDQVALYKTDADSDLMWEIYLKTFPEDVRQEYNCSACRHFIKHYGAVVAIVDGNLVSMWDFVAEEPFNTAVQDLNALVASSTVVELFLAESNRLGTDFNHEHTEDGGIVRWEHVFYYLDKKHVYKGTKSASIDAVLGKALEAKDMLKRALTEITTSSVETVLELIAQNSVYRGQEFKALLESFLKEKKEFEKYVGNADNYC